MIKSGPSNILVTSLDDVGTKSRVKFDGSCLKKDKVTFNYKLMVNI